MLVTLCHVYMQLLCCSRLEDPLELYKASFDAEALADEPRKKRRTGTWRAFVHAESKRQKFSADSMKDLSKKYRELQPEEKQAFENLAEETVGGVGLPAYSGRAQLTRGVPVTLPRRAPGHVWQGGESFKTMFRDFIEGGCVLPSTHYAGPCNPEAGLHTLLGLDDKQLWRHAAFDANIVVNSLSQILRAERKQEKTTFAAKVAPVLSAAVERGKEIAETRAGLQRLPCSWQSFPHLVPPLVAVVSAASLDIKNSSCTTQSLESSWAARHMGLPQSSWTAPPLPKPKRKPCLAKSCCVCSEHGKLALRLGNQVLQYLKTSMQHDPLLQTSILSGRLMLQWQGRGGQALEKKSHDKASASSFTSAPDAVNRWTHIPLHSRRPFCPTLLEMRVRRGVACPVADLHCGPETQEERDAGYVPFEAGTDESSCPLLSTFWRFVRSLDVKKAWAVQVWEPSDRQCPTEDITIVHAKVAAVPPKVLPLADQCRRRRPFRADDVLEHTASDLRKPAAEEEEEAERSHDSDEEGPASEIDESDEAEGCGQDAFMAGSSIGREGALLGGGHLPKKLRMPLWAKGRRASTEVGSKILEVWQRF